MKNKNCPICDNNMIYLERYPKMICHGCVELATTENGENIKYIRIVLRGFVCSQKIQIFCLEYCLFCNLFLSLKKLLSRLIVNQYLSALI